MIVIQTTSPRLRSVRFSSTRYFEEVFHPSIALMETPYWIVHHLEFEKVTAGHPLVQSAQEAFLLLAFSLLWKLQL